ncbi:hypothetical protein L2E82_44966 [Cichorium intybus]|uniref:Uncharacterized protein n=1 Tax=Cichorium intybus TaxID=13427 RepID=A0ACB8ZRQ3_CICIN|nr:hypothetical protein L2E82_44966 [Cichorium intybus]
MQKKSIKKTPIRLDLHGRYGDGMEKRNKSRFSILNPFFNKNQKGKTKFSGENERNGLCCVDGDEAGRPISDLEVQGYFISSAIVIGIYVQDFDLIAIH